MTRLGAGSVRAAGYPLGQRLLALFGLAWLLFDFPLLSLWNRDTLLFGLPLLPVTLFAMWAALIGLLAWTLEGRGAAEGAGISASGVAPGGGAGAGGAGAETPRAQRPDAQDPDAQRTDPQRPGA